MPRNVCISTMWSGFECLLCRFLMKSTSLWYLSGQVWKQYYSFIQTLWIKLGRRNYSEDVDGCVSTNSSFWVYLYHWNWLLWQITDHLPKTVTNVLLALLRYKQNLGSVGVERTQMYLRRCLQQLLASHSSKLCD